MENPSVDEWRSRNQLEREKGARHGRAVPVRSQLVSFGLTVAVLTSCQSYESRPLDPESHREVWHGRNLAAGSPGDLLQRLDVGFGAQATNFDPADGLTLEEGRLVALVFNPDLRLARLRTGLAAGTAEHAGLWADPELSFSVLHIASSVPRPWILAPALGLAIPTSGRLDAEQGLAEAELRAARYRALEANWLVWHEVHAAWVEWSGARLHVEETDRLVAVMETLVRVTTLMAESGELERTEASLFAVEQALHQNQLLALHGDVAVAEQRLRSLMGLAPEAAIELVPSLGLPPELEPIFDERSPSLARLREEYAASEEALRVEIRKQYPDLTLGPAFESDEGQSRAGLLGSLPLPLWNANRQAIAEARAARELARAAFETEYESLVGRWSAASARAAALTQQRADIEEALVPLVDRQLQDAEELMRLGEGSSLLLLESLQQAHQTKLDLIDTRAAEALARAEVEYLVGPLTTGRSTPAIEETP